MPPSPHEVTGLLEAWSHGDKAALDKLTPLVYDELRRLAHHYMSRERAGHTLQTTALVNEAYVRLVDQKDVQWQNRAHFFAVAAPFRVYHDFGASLGGPIRKNKTFFFADYEGSREITAVVANGNTPLVSWRSGDFSGISTQVIDPLTKVAFPGNQIPANRISPVSQKLEDFFFPLPNFGPPTLQSNNWRGQRLAQSGYTHFDNVDVRVDHNFGPRDIVFA